MIDAPANPLRPIRFARCKIMTQDMLARRRNVCVPVSSGGTLGTSHWMERSDGGLMSLIDSAVVLAWRGPFANLEVNRLHAEAFQTRLFDESEWNWRELTEKHSLGWVTARRQGELVGFVNVLWDGLVHAWIQDLMVSPAARRRRIGVRLVHAARDGAARAGCELLHVDFDEHLRGFYLDACGFKAIGAGLMALR